MATVTYCKRHPSVETRLTCSTCGDPICPKCAVPTPVGQKCPDDARLPRGARARGRPRQYAKAIAVGLVAALLGAVVLRLIFGNVGFATWLLSFGVGYGIGRSVRWGAEGNAVGPFIAISVALAVLAVAGAWVWLLGPVFAALPGSSWVNALIPDGLHAITYLTAGFGGVAAFR